MQRVRVNLLSIQKHEAHVKTSTVHEDIILKTAFRSVGVAECECVAVYSEPQGHISSESIDERLPDLQEAMAVNDLMSTIHEAASSLGQRALHSNDKLARKLEV